jgi:tRNA uridine 5-carbamoylmethylation protein Kti12
MLANFILEFFGQLFEGIITILTGIFKGVVLSFNFMKYGDTISLYSQDLGGWFWIVGILCILLVFAFLAGIIYLIARVLRKIIKSAKKATNQDVLVKEVNALNKEVMRLNLEKDKILSMKVSQIGLNPNEISELTGEEIDSLTGGEGKEDEDASRFYKLTQVDEMFKDMEPIEYDNEVDLPEICDRFRNFCCSRLKLFYTIDIIRLFVSSFSSTRLIILQGISGTGKTSLAYAWGKFLLNDALIASVQPSWRDKAEIFGYFNEFTKRYTETDILKQMYIANYTNEVYITVMDEMNIARVEYYFAELLSILEMPSKDEWIVELVASVWESDPIKLNNGKITIPENMWYIGTANNDDSTFAITDKVYDRAMPIDINSKGVAFDAPDTPPMKLGFDHFNKLLEKSKTDFDVSQENLDNLEKLDDYVIEHFRLAFGNRILRQLKTFVPSYMACGGTEIDGIDYVMAKKVFRKFAYLNLAYVRDEIEGLIKIMNKMFGKENMKECKATLSEFEKLV